jgi:hypothetical protein
MVDIGATPPGGKIDGGNNTDPENLEAAIATTPEIHPEVIAA